MSKYYFSKESKIKRILLRIFIVVLVISLGYGAYYYFSNIDKDITTRYLNGTKYEFLNRFYESNNGYTYTYTAKGIVYNAKKSDSEVTFDINAWDPKTKESLYYSNISLGNVKSGALSIEDAFYDFKPVKIQFDFVKKKLVNVEVTDLVLEQKEYQYVNDSILRFLTKGYSANINEEGSTYSADLPVNIFDRNGQISLLPLYVNGDALTALYGIAVLTKDTEVDTTFNPDTYIEASVSRISNSMKANGILSTMIPDGCSLLLKIEQEGVYSDSQINKLRNIFCSQGEFTSIFSRKEESKWKDLLTFVGSEKLDTAYKPDVEFVGLMSLSDAYSMATLYGKTLTEAEVTNVENRIVNSVISSGRDLTTYAVPYKTLCSLAYSLTSVPNYSNMEKYNSVVVGLEDTVSSYSNNEELLKLLEKDTKSTLMCAQAFANSEDKRVRDLFSSTLIKMFYLNMYDKEGHTGLWSVFPEYMMMSIEDSVRYFNLLKVEYAKK